METYISEVIPKIQQFSQKLNELTLLTNQHWVNLDLINNKKIIYIFRSSNELLISSNGNVTKAKWEYLGNKSILIDMGEKSYLFKSGFVDKNIMALKLDSEDRFAIFVNENKYDEELNTLKRIHHFLEKKYLIKSPEEIFKKIKIKEKHDIKYPPDISESEPSKTFNFIVWCVIIIAGGTITLFVMAWLNSDY